MAAKKKKKAAAKGRRRTWVKAHCRRRPERAWQKAARTVREWGW